jgi:serine protease inhibitor
MPRAGHFESVEQRLSAELMADVREQAADHDVVLTLPRFNVETSLDLKQLLAAMGMSAPFFSVADFSGIVADGGLFISDAQHQATMTVDEQGTEPTAATGDCDGNKCVSRSRWSTDPFSPRWSHWPDPILRTSSHERVGVVTACCRTWLGVR